MLKGKCQAVCSMVGLPAGEMSVPLQSYSGITIFVHYSGITIFAHYSRITIFVQTDSHRFYQSPGKNLLQC